MGQAAATWSIAASVLGSYPFGDLERSLGDLPVNSGGSATYSLGHQCPLVLTDGTLPYTPRETTTSFRIGPSRRFPRVALNGLPWLRRRCVSPRIFYTTTPYSRSKGRDKSCSK